MRQWYWYIFSTHVLFLQQCLFKVAFLNGPAVALKIMVSGVTVSCQLELQKDHENLIIIYFLASVWRRIRQLLSYADEKDFLGLSIANRATSKRWVHLSPHVMRFFSDASKFSWNNCCSANICRCGVSVRLAVNSVVSVASIAWTIVIWKLPLQSTVVAVPIPETPTTLRW